MRLIGHSIDHRDRAYTYHAIAIPVPEEIFLTLYLAPLFLYRCIARLLGHEDRIWAMAFSPDGTRLVTGGVDTSIRVWDISGSFSHLALCSAIPSSPTAPTNNHPVQDVVPDVTLAGDAGRVRTLAFSTDGRRLAMGTYDGIIKVWDHEGVGSSRC